MIQDYEDWYSNNISDNAIDFISNDTDILTQFEDFCHQRYINSRGE